MVRLAAVADVHSPKYLKEFEHALSTIQRPDLFLFAGDMVNFGRSVEYQNVIKAIDSSIGTEIPIIACFGNEEHRERRDDVLSIVGTRVKFLDEQNIIVDVDGIKIGIVGAAFPFSSRDRQEIRTEKIQTIFESRVANLSQLLSEISEKSNYTILLLHYSPLLETSGDEMDSFSWWISEVVQESRPNLIIHGHVHSPMKRRTVIGDTVVINVAFPDDNKITEIVL